MLDDYQNVAMESAAWDTLPSNYVVEAFTDHIFHEEELVNRLRGYDIVMAMRERTTLNRSVLEKLPRLKMISTAGMRNAAIDMKAATDLGILVYGTNGSPRDTMELTWGLIFALIRNIPDEHIATRMGAWQKTIGKGLAGSTIGLLGLGRIGAQMAEVAKAFHMEIIAWSQNLTEVRASQHNAKLVTKAQLFSQSDIISVHLILSRRTRGLVKLEDLELMRSSSYLVNTSRGPIVDENALIKVLNEGSIAGAALDVFEPEPLPKDHVFRSMDNIILSPHMGYVTEGTYAIFYGDTLDNIRNFAIHDYTRVINCDLIDSNS